MKRRAFLLSPLAALPVRAAKSLASGGVVTPAPYLVGSAGPTISRQWSASVRFLPAVSRVEVERAIRAASREAAHFLAQRGGHL